MISGMTQERFKDFRPCKDECDNAINILHRELGDVPVDKMLDAMNRRCEADMFFCGSLGYQANLKNFRDPMARTFLNVDFEDYLRVNLLERMPMRNAAEREIDQFYHTTAYQRFMQKWFGVDFEQFAQPAFSASETNEIHLGTGFS